MRAVLRGAAYGALRGADLELSAGRYVVLSNEPGTLEGLIALLSGRVAPKSGVVLLDGLAPARTPALRKRIAALLDEESLPPTRTTLSAVARVLSLRDDTKTSAEAVLREAELSHLAPLSPAALAPRDVRGVALALALCHDKADLLVLHEPLSCSLPRARLLAELERHTLRGATIVTTTASSADAHALGGEWLAVELGRLRAAPLARLGAGPWQQVLVESSATAALASALHGSPLELAVEVAIEPGTLKVTGPALDVTVREVIRLARGLSVEISRIAALAPPVEALLAARAGFARGAYEAARAAAMAPGAVPSVAPSVSSSVSPSVPPSASPSGAASATQTPTMGQVAMGIRAAVSTPSMPPATTHVPQLPAEAGDEQPPATPRILPHGGQS